MDKKAFQAFVKQFRGKKDKFPKAMMFGSQTGKRQATINCGNTSKSGKIVEKIVETGLEEFLEEHEAKYRIEKKLDNRHNVISQIRIYY